MSKFVLTAQLQLQAPNNVSQVVSQIQNQLNNVSVNVQVKGAAQANQQIQQITQSTKAATTAADRMGRAFAVSIRRFAAFSIATRAVGLFTSTLSEAVQTAIDFERELIKISQVTGRSVSSLRDLTDSVTNLSTNLGVTSQSLLEVTTVLTQAGLSSDDTKIALESLAKAALAPNFDSIQETAEGAIAILAQFKQGVGALEGQLSSIDAVAGAFAVEAGDLIDVIRRSGGVFKASGGSLNELLALFTSVRATTRESAESIGTGLRTIFTRIQRPETIEFLKQFGVELVDLNGKFVGPYEAIKRLSEALSGLGEGDLTFIRIAEELGGFRQIGKVLPLLQQFSTAQAALNVAQNAGNGLTKNAETAQAALAIRIIKVREEFLALIRSMTETPTFQIMANAALSLASALIKIADSIKPLLPLLGAVAAFKAVKGIGGFLGGIGAGLTSGKTFSAGGKVQAFATGGLVPGSGNRDTVPAMLTPGEFVIRKSSVQKLGASNLKQMNTGGSVSHFAVGGKASRKVDYEKGVAPSPFASAKSNKLGQEAYALQKNSGLSQFEFDDAKRFADANGYNLQQFKTLIAKRAQDKKNKAGLKTNTADLLSTLRGSSEAKTLSPEAEKLRVMLGGTPRKFATGGRVFGAVGLTPMDDIENEKGRVIIGTGAPKEVSISSVLARKAGGSGSTGVFSKDNSRVKKTDWQGAIRSAIGGPSVPTEVIGRTFKLSDLENTIGQQVDGAISSLVTSTAQTLGTKTGVAVEGSVTPNILSSIGTRSTIGSIFEGALSLLGAPFDKSISSEQEPFDFPSGLGAGLSTYFGFGKGIPVEAKKNLTPELMADIANRKATNLIAEEVYKSPQWQSLLQKKHFGGIIQKFNAGGVAKIQSLKFSNFRDIEKFLDDMWIRGIQEERGKRYDKDKSFIRDSDSWTFKHPLVGSVSLTGKETEELYAYWESQKKSLLKKQKFQVDPTEAILDYKTDSSDINTGLSDKTLTKDQKKQVSTLKKLSTDKLPKTLYSGIGFNRTSIIQNQIGKNLLQSTGKTFALPGFLSTSSDVGVAKRFGSGLLLRIATNPARKGVAADKHVSNEYQHEKEFILPPNSKFKVSRFASNTLGVAQLNKGGIANAPLVDDINNATNTVLPRPSLAIARLLQAGGGAVDIDRTIKRTIGDKAFGSAKTDPQRTAALQTYFRDDAARLRDVQTAPLTQFGQELQSIIKSGKLDARKISIVSKSKRVPGVAEYLSKLFGIPIANMAFTAGQSKEPAMEAIRTKGPRVDRVRKFFGGIIPQQFASGGLVPGVGNSDTVPASLQEGDFVIRKSSVAKLGVENLASMSGYAAGGNVGKSVPALLTPGEWVVSKDQAQSIGYGNLNRMNKVGKFAQGGVVQRFASGTGTSGAVASSSPSSSSQPSGSLAAFNAAFKTSTQTVQQNTNAQQQDTQIQQQSTQSTQDNSDAVEKNSLSFFAATMGLGAVQAALASITPVIDKNSTAFERASASILNSVSSLTNTIGIAVIALQQLNIQITAATAKMIAQNAFDFLTGAKSLTEVFKTAKDGIPGLKNFTSSFKMGAKGMAGPLPEGKAASIGYKVGNIANKLTGGGDAFAGTKNLVNNANITKNRLSGALSFGFDQGKAGISGSAASSSVKQYMSQYTSAGPVSRFASGLSANIGAKAGAITQGVTDSKVAKFASAGITKAKDLGATISSSFNYGRNSSDLGLNLKDIGKFAQSKAQVFQNSGKVGSFAANVSAKAGAITQKGVGLASRVAQGVAGVAAKAAAPVGNLLAPIIGPLTNQLAPVVSKVASAFGTLKPSLSNFDKLSGMALGVGLAFQAVTSVVDAYIDYQGKANKAIQDGNVEKAASMSKEAAGADAINSLGSTIIGASALFGPFGLALGTATAAALKIGSELPVVGPLLKSAAIKIGTLFGGKTEGSIMALAAAQAQGVATQKALAQSGEAATKAMTDFQNGSISAVQALAATASGGASVMKEAEVNKKAIEENNKNKAGGISGVGRDVLALGGFNPFLETSAARNTRIDNENKQLSETNKKSQETLIQQSTPAINALSGDIAAAGGTFNDVMDQIKATNPGLYFALLNQGSGELSKSFDNIKKEVERAQKAFNAMNLGMQNVQGAAAAAALGVNNYVAAQQAGNIGLEQSLAVLEASVTSAAQGISDADFGKALNDAESTLRGFGASDQQVDKFRGNISAVNEVQKNQSTIFAGAKDKLAANIRKSNSADERKKAFSATIDEQLKAAGYDEETRKRFKDATGNMSDDQLKKIGEGDFSAFEESINELGKKTMEQVNGPLKAAIEIQKQLNDLTKQRIEAERQLMNAQIEASNVRMEAMDIAAKYGGPKVTPEMRAKNIVQQANIQSQGIKGVTDLKTGSAQELSQRTQQLSTRQAEISAIRMRAAQGDAGAQQQLQGESGLKLQEEEKKLQDAAKSQIQATRDLIKSKEEELRLIKEKNQLEKNSIDALVSGDIEKFFDQQAAVGAQAAIATGDQRMINQFGSSALGAAAQETRRQQEAGVTELYGQQLSGPGGLTERAYGAALSSSGIQNPLAMAQVAAGSTGAEAAIESDIRDLAATMGPAADVQVQAANDQLIAAQMQLDAARAKGEEAVVQMQARQAPGMATGGMVYASRGIFVPRGTDTVPAMLTPGEFVVNRAAVQRGNNLQILQSMNKGVSASAPAASSQSGDVAAMASGGIVRYRSGGSTGPEAGGMGISAESLSAFASALSQFNTELTKNIQTLASTKFEITLNPTNINVNLTGTSFLSNLAANIKQDLLKFLGQEISNYSVGNDGKLRKSGSTLGTIT